MSDARGIAAERAVVRIFIETNGRLDLGNVGRFMQRLDTVARRAAAPVASQPRIEIVSVSSGSLELRIAVASLVAAVGSLAFDAGSFALSIADALKNEPAASRSCRALLEGDNGTVIIVEGGGTGRSVSLGDLAPDYPMAANRGLRPPPREEVAEAEMLTGPQDGFIRRMGGEDWVELESRPGLIIRIRDQRENDAPPLEPNLRYTLDGEAHLAPAGQESFFVLRKAMRLG